MSYSNKNTEGKNNLLFEAKPVREGNQNISSNNNSNAPTISARKDVSVSPSQIPTRCYNNRSTEVKPFNLSFANRSKVPCSLRIRSGTHLDSKTNDEIQTRSINDSFPKQNIEKRGIVRQNTCPISGRAGTSPFSPLPGCHKVGQIPKYMQKIGRRATENSFSSQKKTFITLKKKLAELQSEFLQSYKTMTTTQIQINKRHSNMELCNKLEQIELIAVVIDGEKIVLTKENDNDDCFKKNCLVRKQTVDTPNEIYRQLQCIFEGGYSLCKEILHNFNKITNSMEADNCGDNPIMKKLDAISQNMEERINNDKRQFKILLQKILSVFFVEEMSSEKDMHRKLTDIVQFKQLVKHPLEEFKEASTNTEPIEVRGRNLENVELVKDMSHMRIKRYEGSRNDNGADKMLKLRNEELNNLYENERRKTAYLENDLKEKNILLEKLVQEYENHKKSVLLGSGDRYQKDRLMSIEVEELTINLRNAIEERNSLKVENKILEEKNKESLDLKIEITKFKDEISHLMKANEMVRNNLTKMEVAHNQKEETIAGLEKRLQKQNYINNACKELNTLRESEGERKREIDHLKCEIAKCHIEIKQQEETIFMHQRLLRIRSELINSLQEKEASNRCRMDDLYTEITKKSSQLNQVNHEISAKTEELQNLFSTLGTKQMELTRQDHIIKMLEENNDRNQRLRVKQEEKICRLENEVAELRKIIKLIDLKANIA